MSPKRPVYPSLLVLPLAAFTLTAVALVAHAATGHDEWNRYAQGTDLAGLALSVLALVAGLIDAVELPAFTIAREAGLRHVAFSMVGLVLFGATAAAIGHDALALALGAAGFAAIAIACWYGRIVLLAFETGETIVHYPAWMHAPARRRPGSARTLV